MITTAQILDLAISRVTDNSAGARAKMLTWLNARMQDIASMRDWKFLEKEATLPLTLGASVWPVDFEEALSFTVGSSCIYPSARLSDKDKAASAYGGEYGYRVDDTLTGFTIYPAPDSCVLNYKVTVPTYADDTTATVFPVEMLNVFARAVVTDFYEYDTDDRAGTSMALYQQALKEAKKWDNKLKPLPRRDRRSILWSNT
jgi:hypothetical protein